MQEPRELPPSIQQGWPVVSVGQFGSLPWPPPTPPGGKPWRGKRVTVLRVVGIGMEGMSVMLVAELRVARGAMAAERAILLRMTTVFVVMVTEAERVWGSEYVS
jgi:hypothetical protein